MIEISWWNLISVGVLSALGVKVLDIAYQEIRRKSTQTQSVSNFIELHLAPVLNSADELVGKLRSLSNEDFKSVSDINLEDDLFSNKDVRNLVFCLARFWSNIELIRSEQLSFFMNEDARGEKLKQFIDCIESTKVRLVDRISQRAIADLMLVERGEKLQIATFIEFVHSIESDPKNVRWLEQTVRALSQTRNTAGRQKLLQYGIVIHAMIDTLDPKHKVTKNRTSYPNKLSQKSWAHLKYRVFGKYLTFVSDTQKYLGPPKRRPQAGK